MKRFLSAVALCLFLLLFGMFSLLTHSSQAKENILQKMLALPAPPPPNPLYKATSGRRDKTFYDKKNPPKDDAPIEDLVEYWKHQSSNYRELGYNIKPSENTVSRIIGEIDKNPENLADFLNILPDSPEAADFVKKIYDQSNSNQEIDKWEKDRVKRWLKLNSKHFGDELLSSAKQAGDVGEYVGNQDELLSLVRVDWDNARPLVERLYNDPTKPASQVLARWALYKRALETNSFGDIERYRDELKTVVEDKSATAGMRDLAFDALVKETDWSGRDDWYFTLLEDETLADLRVNGRSYTGLTTIVLYSPPDKYADKMLELVKSNNPVIRNAAVRNLGQIIDKDHPEVVKALLPWLEKPDWANQFGGERVRLVQALESLEMPESVSGLIDLLDEKQLREVYIQPNSGTANTMTNTATMSSNSYYSSNAMSNSAYYANSGAVKTTMVAYPFRYSAISALIMQKDIRAVAALRRLLPEVEQYERNSLVKALLVSGGFSIPEQLEAIEIFAQGVKSEIKQEIIDEAEQERLSALIADSSESGELDEIPVRIGTRAMGIGSGANNMPSIKKLPFNPAEIKPILGAQIAANAEPNADFLKSLVERVGVLESRDPQLAQALRRIVQNWRGAAVNALLLNDLKNNKLELEAVVKLLSIRKELREKQANEVYSIRGGSPFALGISACLLEDNGEYDAILANENTEVKASMLACARLIRARLPILKVVENLKSQDKMLAIAAESYLESEDSPEARQIVLSLHPNKAKILGATSFFGNQSSTSLGGDSIQELFASVNAFVETDSYYYLMLESSNEAELEASEKKLQKEVIENQELLGVYAYDDNFIRIYKDRAVFSWEEDVSRYRERVLEKEEFDNFKSFLASQKVDELAPFLSNCSECDAKELVMLGRGGGRRVFVRADPLPEFFVELEKLFEDMRRPPAKLHYWLEKDIAGLEILFADDNLKAETLWKNGADFRLLIENTERLEQIEKELIELQESFEDSDLDYYKRQEKLRQRRKETESQHLTWFKFNEGNAVDVIGLPPSIEYPAINDGLEVPASNEQWKAKTSNFEIRVNQEGLYKKSGGQINKIRDGYYTKPVVTANGRWAIAVKYFNERELMRVNLQTGKESVITNEESVCEPLISLNSINKVLIVCGQLQGYYDREDGDDTQKVAGDYYLLDAETGAVQKAKGEFRPLAAQTFRPLQPTGKPDEFYAAIPDEDKNQTLFGIYNAKTFTFKERLKIPQIAVASMNIWVDEAEGKIYLVYEGQLLSLPMK